MWPFISRKISIADSRLLDGFTDWHSHLLPGVDDGVQHPDESMAILALLEEEGVKAVWLTPHIMEDIPNTTSGLAARFDTLKASYAGGIQLDLAAENMLDVLFADRMAANDLLTYHKQSILVETSYINPPMGMDSMLEDIRKSGMFPVLAHPERYRYMDEASYERLHDAGVRFQLNLPSLTGGYGEEAMHKAAMLLGKGYYHIAGLDLHSIRHLKRFLESKMTKKELDRTAEFLYSSMQ